jgi:hypothetical protein
VPRLAENKPIKPFSLLAKRWLLCTALVFATYNPSGFSYYHWITGEPGSVAFKLFIGVLLLTVLVAIGRMTFASLGLRGSIAVFALLVASLLVRIGLGWVEFREVQLTTYTVLLWISTLLGVGMSWSFFERRISGERDVLRQPP